MDVTPAPTDANATGGFIKGSVAPKKTWSTFLFRHWKWLIGLMVFGFIIDFFDGDRPGTPQQKTAVPTEQQPRSEVADKANEEAKQPQSQSLPLRRKWTESDQDLAKRGVIAVAESSFGHKVETCDLEPAAKPWKGFRGKVVFNNEQRLVEAHVSGSTFVVAFHLFSNWLSGPADFLDSAGKTLSREDFCKRAYGKSLKDIEEMVAAEEDKHQTASSLWNLGTNEAALRKRLPGRFTVEGKVFQIKQEYGSWIVRLFVHQNERGVDRWIECVMKNNKGLESISQGSFVTIEGAFAKTSVAGPELKDCQLLKK